MTFRVNSTYGSGSWGGNCNHYYGHEKSNREKSNHISIWGNTPSSNDFERQQGLDFLRRSGIDTSLLNKIEDLLNSDNQDFGYENSMSNEDPMSGPIPGMQGLNYIKPGASFAPMDGIMTAPFGANDNLFGSNQNSFNPFATSISSSRMPMGNNIFRNTTVNANNFNSLKFSNTSLRTGNFGSQSINGHLTNIHTPSGNFNFADISKGNSIAGVTSLSGNIESYKHSVSKINSPDAHLTRVSDRIETPTEYITRTRTVGTMSQSMYNKMYS